MRYGSVCSGIEAASQAWQPLGWTPEFFSEIDKFPSAVLAHHYGSNMPDEPYATNGVPNYGDMSKFKEWPDHGQQSDRPIDLLVGGTPCQSFSVAGLREGLNDPRGNLMLTFGAIAKRYQPRWVIWENVPGVLSSNKGRDFGAFLRLLGECGYGFAYRVLDAQYVRVDGFERAVPQRRRRVFVVGYLGDWRPAAAVLSEPEGLFGNPAPSRKAGQGIATDVAPCLGASGRGVKSTGDIRGQDPVVAARMVSFGEYEVDGTASTMKERDYKDATDLIAFNSRQDTEVTGDRSGPLDSSSPQAQAVAFAQNTRDKVRLINGDGSIAGALAAEAGMKQQTYVSQVSPTVSVGPPFSRTGNERVECDALVAENWHVRRLMPIECERLQGFPEIKKKATIIICWEDKLLQSADAAYSCTTKPNSASSVEEKKSKNNAAFAKKYSNAPHQEVESVAHLHVQVNFEAKIVVISNAEKLLWSASFAEITNLFPPLINQEDFVQSLVKIAECQEKIVLIGKAVSLQNKLHSTPVKNGSKYVVKSGNGTEERAEGAINTIADQSHPFRFTISKHGQSTPLNGLIPETSCCYALNAIALCILPTTQIPNFCSITVESIRGFTQIPWRGKSEENCPDGPRYKALGNSMAINCMRWIGQRIVMVESIR